MKQQHNLSDEELQQLYVMQATEQPSQALDEIILDQAKLHKATFKPNKSDKVVFLSQYRWQISTAASVLLVSTLLLLNYDHMDNALLMETQPLLQEHAPTPAPAIEVQVMSTATPKAARIQKSLSNTEAASVKVSDDVVMSDEQLFKQLYQLVEDKQWQQADKLLKRLQKQRPELTDPLHPQYKEWLALREQITTELAK